MQLEVGELAPLLPTSSVSYWRSACSAVWASLSRAAPGEGERVILCGSPGVGKSHLFFLFALVASVKLPRLYCIKHSSGAFTVLRLRDMGVTVAAQHLRYAPNPCLEVTLASLTAAAAFRS